MPIVNAPVKPGFFRDVTGILKRIPPKVEHVPVKAVSKPVARPQTPKPCQPKADSLRAPLRGQGAVKRGMPGYIKHLAIDLESKYPAIAQDLPLKVGVLADLVNVAGIDHRTARAFMRHWTSREKYLASFATVTHRYNLDGTLAGELLPKHRIHAAQQLKLLKGIE